MRKLTWVLVLALLACDERAVREEQTDVPDAVPTTADYAEPIVLFVDPDSLEIARLHEQLGDDAFYTTADDAMWYRASAYELLDSLQIPYSNVERGSASFLVDGQPTEFSWADVARTWFLVMYDGSSPPTIVSPIDIHDAVAGMRTPE